MDHISFRPIGTIHSPFKKIEGMPIQPSAAKGIKGHIIIREDFVEGLCDLDGFSHIYLLYHFHLSKSYTLKVIPFLDNEHRGVFSTRAPKRPNPIGLSVVKLNKIKLNVLHIENVDIIDGTPLLDIKPYVQEMDEISHYKLGWLSKHMKDLNLKNSDTRFK
jgi:tRNA-Thr(GGU) m(6)t(6)A37 methyltransferase TsaA